MTRSIIIVLALLMTSCASDFSKYKSRTDYNLMQCQKMCSSGNVIQIEKFNCACNLRSSGQSSNTNRNNASGNTTVIYNRAPAAQNSGFQQFLNGMAQWGANSDRNRQRQYLNQSSGWTKPSSVVPNRYAPVVPASNVFGILGD